VLVVMVVAVVVIVVVVVEVSGCRWCGGHGMSLQIEALRLTWVTGLVDGEEGEDGAEGGDDEDIGCLMPVILAGSCHVPHCREAACKGILPEAKQA